MTAALAPAKPQWQPFTGQGGRQGMRRQWPLLSRARPPPPSNRQGFLPGSLQELTPSPPRDAWLCQAGTSQYCCLPDLCPNVTVPSGRERGEALLVAELHLASVAPCAVKAVCSARWHPGESLNHGVCLPCECRLVPCVGLNVWICPCDGLHRRGHWQGQPACPQVSTRVPCLSHSEFSGPVWWPCWTAGTILSPLASPQS